MRNVRSLKTIISTVWIEIINRGADFEKHTHGRMKCLLNIFTQSHLRCILFVRTLYYRLYTFIMIDDVSSSH